MIEKGETETQFIEEALRDEEGPLDFVDTRDITDFKRAEDPLRECEEHYFSLYKNMLNGFAYCQMHWEQDRPVDFTYLEVNDVFEELTRSGGVYPARSPGVQPRAVATPPRHDRRIHASVREPGRLLRRVLFL